jgi:TonB family protein
MEAMLIAPADCPKTVTLPGSPPNAAIFSCTNVIATAWSSRPQLPTRSPDWSLQRICIDSDRHLFVGSLDQRSEFEIASPGWRPVVSHDNRFRVHLWPLHRRTVMGRSDVRLRSRSRRFLAIGILVLMFSPVIATKLRTRNATGTTNQPPSVDRTAYQPIIRSLAWDIILNATIPVASYLRSGSSARWAGNCAGACSGRYDEGLAVAVHGNDTTWRHPSFRDLLNDYRGPITDSEAKAAAFSTDLVDAGQYRFNAFTKPDYPVLAAMARIQGDVTMRLSIDPATGEVTSVEAFSGNKILQDNAVAAAKKWRLEPSSAGAEKVNATLRYSLQCR